MQNILIMESYKEYTKVIDVFSFEDYVNKIRVVEKEIRDVEQLIFRGQSVDKDLYPKIGRKEYSVANRLEYEKRIFEEFERLSIPYLKNQNLSKWDILALAQHHFLPTRLLDWTENPLTALWFAFNEESQIDTQRIVWVYGFSKDNIIRPGDNDPFEQQVTKVFRPKHITLRLTSQTGWFTCHYYSPADKRNKYSALNRLKRNKLRLYALKFTGENEDLRNDILNKLNTFGINSYSIFPDLEGLCKYLEWKIYKRK